MKYFCFPSIEDTSFIPFSQKIRDFKFDPNGDQVLLELAGVMAEFFDQLTVISQRTQNKRITFKEVVSRSEILLGWVELLYLQTQQSETSFPPNFNFSSLLLEFKKMKKIFSHPVLTSIWLGLENITSVIEDKEEREYLNSVLFSTHYESEIPGQFQYFILQLQKHVDVKDQIIFFEELEEEKFIDLGKVDSFIANSSQVIYEIAVLGRIDLLQAALQMYGIYFNYLHNKYLFQSHGTVIKRIKAIKNRSEQPASHNIESVYALGTPLFDVDILQSKRSINIRGLPLSKPISKSKIMAVPPDVSLILEKLENNLNFVMDFRGKLTKNRTQRYILEIKRILTQTIDNKSKAHYVEVFTKSWYRWVTSQFKDNSILFNETVSMASALAVKIKESENFNYV